MSDNQNYLIGSRRVRPVFLWFPRRLSGELRFFGWHRVCQEYTQYFVVGKTGGTQERYYQWDDVRWYTPADSEWGKEKYPMGDD